MMGRRGGVSRKRRSLTLAAAAVVAMASIVAGTIAATHSLTPAGCIDDNDAPQGPDTCAGSIDGLDGATQVIVTADGASAYAVSFEDDSIVQFSRDSTGVLTPVGCIDDNDAPAGPDTCAASADGLNRPFGLAVSRDGESVYVASADDDAVVHFDRDPTTGALTWVGCIDDNDAPQGPDTCAGSTNGLDGAKSVAVSPDGRSVYVIGLEDDAVVRLARSTANGTLTPGNCIDDTNGADSCGAGFAGLNNPFAVAVSPDGTSVYAAVHGHDSIVRLIQNAGTDTISYAGCIDDNDSGLATCASSTDGLSGARSIAISPDGESLYVASEADDAVVRFQRDTGGGGLIPPAASTTTTPAPTHVPRPLTASTGRPRSQSAPMGSRSMPPRTRTTRSCASIAPPPARSPPRAA